MGFSNWMVIPLFAVMAPVAEQESSPDAKRAVAAAAGQALQGNMKRALAELDSVPSADFRSRESAFRACMKQRFAPDADGSLPTEFGPFTNRALGIYRAYWRAALLYPENRVAEEERLHRNLARLSDLPLDTDPNRVREETKARLAAEGGHALNGRTAPFLELMVWRKEASALRNMTLPESDYEVLVAILDDFASLGWSAYGTCDRSSTGGWVGTEAIYAVKPRWKSLEDENFRISFLVHETQHFADKKRFAKIETWELEYRAKLAELALAGPTIPRLLGAFASNRGDDPAVPHSFANGRVVDHLRRELKLGVAADRGGIGVGAINQAARVLLVRDSQQRAGTG